MTAVETLSESTSERRTTLTLGDELTIPYAAETAARVTQALALAPSALHLDLAAVQDLDTAGLQVLLWAGREAAASGVPFELTTSPSVAHTLSIAGLDASALTTDGAR